MIRNASDYNHPPESFDGIMVDLEKPRQKYIKSITHISFALIFVCFLWGLYWIVNSIAGILPTPLKISDEVAYPNAFIAERAHLDLKSLTELGPRITGTTANDEKAVDFLETEVKKIISEAHKNQKIEFDIQLVSGLFNFSLPNGMAISSYRNIQNVVVKLHGGGNSSNSLLVNSHFDSVPSSPGASDDGINVAAMLEVLRKITRKDTRPLNNIIFLFNGAEETPLQASHGFITQHKWAKDCKVVVNLDSCGLGGRSILFQTGPKQSWLLNYYKKVPHPYAQVAGEEIFQSGIIPSGTDFRIFRDYGGVVGLDMAFYKNGYVYHTKFDMLENLELGSLQNVGDNTLSLVENLGNSSEVATNKKIQDQNAIYFDYLGAFTVTYSEHTGMIINLLVVAFSIGTFLNSLRSIDLNADSQSWKYLGLAFGAIIAGWISSVIFVILVALLLDCTGFSMTWYTHTWLIFGLYSLPTVILSALVLLFVKTKIIPEQDQVEVETHIVRFIWTCVLFMGTILTIRGSYAVCVPVLFNSIAFVILSVLRTKFSVENWQFIYIPILIIPTMLLMYQTDAVFSLFVPITGRIGPDKNADMVIGVLSVVFTILITSPFIPLLKMMRNPKWFLGILTGLFVLFLIMAFTPLGFPYGENPKHPTPQRYWIMHTDRIVHGKDSVPIKRESGFFLLNMDRNSPRMVEKYITRFNESRTVEEDCKNYLVCGYPVSHPKMTQILEYSTWIPESAPEILDQPTRMIVNSRKYVAQDVIQYNITVSGPNRVIVYLSPTLGSSVVNTSLLEIEPKSGNKNERELYYILHTYGKEPSPLTITFDVRFPKKNDNSTYIELAVGGIYVTPEAYMTKPYKEFLDSFPKWADVTAWVGTYESWRLAVDIDKPQRNKL